MNERSEDVVVDPWDDEPAVKAVLDLRPREVAYSLSPADLTEVQLAAVQARLETTGAQIPVVRHRAEGAGIDKVTTPEDLVPLLLPHQVYRSYPNALVEQGRWDRMQQWYCTVSTAEDLCEFGDLESIDEWLVAMKDAGRGMFVTSGTSGKSGLFPVSGRDRARNDAIAWERVETLYAEAGADPSSRMPHFVLSFRSGHRKVDDLVRQIAEQAADPERTFFLFGDHSVAGINRIGAARLAARQGSISPGDLAEVNRLQEARRAEVELNWDRIVDQLVAHLDEPVVVRGFWAELVQLVARLQARGVRPGCLSPGSVLWGGGGVKADQLPPDYIGLVRSFFAGTSLIHAYAMTEVLPWYHQCRADRWHAPAQVVPLLLDEAGERLVPTGNGQTEGRLGMFDLTLRDRWGGIMTSDWVTVDTDPCPCGLPSLSVLQIGRVSDGADDKLSCAGTLDAYVSSVVLA